jgi:hypothetical protein
MKNLNAFNQSPIVLQTSGTIGFEELTPLLVELNKSFAYVRASVSAEGFEPADAGFTHIALTIATWGGLEVAKAFIQTLVDGSSDGIRAELRRIISSGGKSKINPRKKFAATALELSGVRFYFEHSLDDEELRHRLAKAYEFIGALPASVTSESCGPSEYGLAWNRSTDSWEGSIQGYGEFKYPVLHRDEGENL